MKSLTTKKIIIVFGVVLAISVGMIVLGLSFGNTKIPSVESPSEVVYERVDENGDVIYTITKQELYEQIKTNNGVNQVIALLDEVFLADYLDQVTQAEIDEKIEFLTYQTNDPDVIADYDADTLADLEENFRRSMVLSGYHEGQEETYAKLVVAREKFAVNQIISSGDITEEAVAEYYISEYFEDIKALRLRFLNKGDAVNVLEQFNLAEVDGELAMYLGYSFINEDLVYGEDDQIVEAQITVDTYFEDVNGNLVDVFGETVYTKANETYLDQDDNIFTMDTNGNIIDDESVVIVSNTLIFDTLEDAETYKEDNTTYYTLTLNGDLVEVYDETDTLVYKIDDEIIYDAMDVDVTDSVDLRLNKEFNAIEDVTTFTVNNTSTLTNDEVLTYYIKMYNYIYGEYRDTLDENATLNDLLALNNEYFDFDFETVNDQSQALATYMFSTVSGLNDKVYTAEPHNVGDYTYMVYKLSEGTKVDLKSLVMGVIESSIIVPIKATTDIDLITEGPYNSTITWTSSNPEVISNTGTVVLPEEDSIISLSYTISALGTTKTGVKIVQVPITGENSEIATFDQASIVTLKTLLNDDALYAEIEDLILEEMVYGDSSSTTITSYLTDARKAANIEFYDYFMALDYSIDFDTTYEKSNRGSSSTLASIELADGTTFKLSAEAFYQSALDRNPTLMMFYAAQYKEAIYSDYYELLFGENRNILKNDSEYMGYLDNYVASIKNEYNQFISNPTYLSLYEQYYGWDFDSFQTYLYTRYRVEDEITLLENLVLSELRMLFIQETLEDQNVVDLVYENVENNYDNFFSLNAKQILIYFDFDEDGSLDDYIEYYDSLSDVDQAEFDALVSQLENLIKDSEDTFTDIVSDYEGVSREDEDWGAFKQHGFILKYESLNPQDDNEVEQSITYSGDYGVKDTYIEEFTLALMNLYEEYQNPVNADLDSMLSGLVPTIFGLHLIEVEKGDDFDGISLNIAEDDYANISDIMLNNADMPSLEQVDAYFTYKLYAEFNDLENVSMMNKYGVTLPIIPDQVITDLDFYAADTLENLFGSNMVNYAFISRVADGNILSGITQANFDENIETLLEIYYDVTIGSITLE